MIVAMTANVDDTSKAVIRRRMAAQGVEVMEIPSLVNPNKNVRNANFKNNYAVLNLWNLTLFQRIVSIDADMIATKSLDDLCRMDLQSNHILAAKNWWTAKKDWDEKVFNGGLMIFEPDQKVYGDLVEKAKTFKSSSGGVQPFLNEYFNNRWQVIDSRVWGMNANAYSLRPDAWVQSDIHVLHYTTKAKPCHTSPGEFLKEKSDHPYVIWHQMYNSLVQFKSRKQLVKWDRRKDKREVQGSRKACILYMLTKESGPTGKDYLNLVKRSILSLERFFFPVSRYPICIMHTDDVTLEDLDDIAASTESEIRAYPIEFSFPFHKKSSYLKQTPTAPGCISKYNPNDVWHVNYLHMCHYYTHDIFTHPVFSDFDWLLRLDADSGLGDMIPCDPFEILAEGNKVFGYYKKEKQGGRCAEGFHDKVMQEYVKKSGRALKHPVEPNDVYLGAFHVFKTSFFITDEVLKFWDWVDYTAVAYENRTGEQAVIPYALAIHADLDQIHQFAGYSLWHRTEMNSLWPERLALPTGCPL